MLLLSSSSAAVSCYRIPVKRLVHTARRLAIVLHYLSPFKALVSGRPAVHTVCCMASKQCLRGGVLTRPVRPQLCSTSHLTQRIRSLHTSNPSQARQSARQVQVWARKQSALFRELAERKKEAQSNTSSAPIGTESVSHMTMPGSLLSLASRCIFLAFLRALS